jgi:hypothetical protein
MWRLLVVWALTMACFPRTCSLATGALLQSDDFQLGLTDGWVGNIFAQPSLQPTGGPIGDDDAFLLVSTSSPTGPGSNLAAHNSNSNWAGDYSGIEASKVTVDLMSPLSSSSLEMRVVLFGPQFVSERWTSTNAVSVPSDGVWRNYEFSLAEADLTQFGGTNSYEDLMGNVLRLMLRHDEGSPSAGGSPIDGSFGMDNIQLASATPMRAGDFDDDGDVDGVDFLRWQRSDGAAETLTNWQGNYGMNNLTADSSLVPEPSCLVFFTTGIVYCLLAGIRSGS